MEGTAQTAAGFHALKSAGNVQDVGSTEEEVKFMLNMVARPSTRTNE